MIASIRLGKENKIKNINQYFLNMMLPQVIMNQRSNIHITIFQINILCILIEKHIKHRTVPFNFDDSRGTSMHFILFYKQAYEIMKCYFSGAASGLFEYFFKIK